MALRMISLPLMLPLMKVILLRTSARFSSLPPERSSRTTTLWPRRTSSSTVFEPMKPAPPVTRKRIRKILPERISRRQAEIEKLLELAKTRSARFDTLKSMFATLADKPGLPRARLLYDGNLERQGL